MVEQKGEEEIPRNEIILKFYETNENELQLLLNQMYGLLKYFFITFVSGISIIAVNSFGKFNINSTIIFFILLTMAFSSFVVCSITNTTLVRIWAKSFISVIYEEELECKDIGYYHIHKNIDERSLKIVNRDRKKKEEVSKLYKFFIPKKNKKDPWFIMAVVIIVFGSVVFGFLLFLALLFIQGITFLGIILSLVITILFVILFIHTQKFILQYSFKFIPTRVKIYVNKLEKNQLI